MAVIDSRTAGVLSVLDKENTETPINVVRAFISAVTGISLKLVRQAWLQYPATQPALDDTWCAVQLDGVRPVGTAMLKGKRGDLTLPESGDVTSVLHEELSFTVSFYGSDAMSAAGDLVSGLQLNQTIQTLRRKGLDVRSVDENVSRRPDLMLNRWVDRYVVTFRLTRKTSRRYGVRTLAAFDGIEIHTEKGTL